MNPLDFTQLGVSSVVVLMLLIAVKTLWKKLEDSQAQNRADVERVMPALIAATNAMTEVAKVANRMADRERGLS